MVFDRCPLDLIAYLEVVSAGEGFEWSPDGKLLGRIEKALASLDLLGVRAAAATGRDRGCRSSSQSSRAWKVDARLKTMLREDDLGLLADGPRVIDW